jgi:hypothetical protein
LSPDPCAATAAAARRKALDILAAAICDRLGNMAWVKPATRLFATPSEQP